jgi:hypothetical protein
MSHAQQLDGSNEESRIRTLSYAFTCTTRRARRRPRPTPRTRASGSSVARDTGTTEEGPRVLTGCTRQDVRGEDHRGQVTPLSSGRPAVASPWSRRGRRVGKAATRVPTAGKHANVRARAKILDQYVVEPGKHEFEMQH